MLLGDPQNIGIFVLLLLVVVAFYKVIKIFFGILVMLLRKARIRHVEVLIDQLYPHDINPYHVSLEYRENNKIKGEEYTYGEVVAYSFAEILQLTSPKKNEVFYDLGCGAGRAVFTVALCYPELRVRGVELLPPMYELCEEFLKRFRTLTKEDKYFTNAKYDIKFIQGNLLEYDFSDGNIIFLNATCFREKDWKLLQKRLLVLPEGSRVIVVSRELTDDAFERISAGTYLMSWGMSSVFVYKKTS